MKLIQIPITTKTKKNVHKNSAQKYSTICHKFLSWLNNVHDYQKWFERKTPVTNRLYSINIIMVLNGK